MELNCFTLPVRFNSPQPCSSPFIALFKDLITINTSVADK